MLSYNNYKPIKLKMDSKTFQTILPEFIESLQEKGRSPSTILAYRADVEQLVDFAVKRQKPSPEMLVPQDIADFRDFLMSKKYTAKTVSRKLNAIKTFYRWLKDEGYITRDPSKDIEHPKIEASMPKFLNELEYRALRDVVRDDPRITAIVELILQTGMRISEIANLKIHNLKGDKIIIEKHATQPKRTVTYNESARNAVENYLKIRPKADSEYVFISKTGNPLAVRNIRAAIDKYMQKAGVPQYSVNDIRSTFIVENLKRGVDLVTVSQAVGHKRLSTTERYLELAGIEESGKSQNLAEL